MLVPQKGVSRSISTNCGRGSKKPLKIFAQKEELNTMACVSNILPHTSTQTLSLRAVKRSAQFCISLTKFVPWTNAFWPGLTPFGPLLW